MKKRSLRFKMILGGILVVFVPLAVVGYISSFEARDALENTAESQALEVAKGLAYIANLAVQEEMKIAAQVAHRENVREAAAQHGQGTANPAEIAKLTAELTEVVQKSNKDYETINITGLNGKVFADGDGGKRTDVDLSDRDYFKTAKEGKINVGTIVRSKTTGNLVLPFAAPIYSKSNQVIGVVATIANISFLADKISATKLGKTGYAYIIEKTGLVIVHPNKDLILVTKTLEQEGMKGLATRMVAGETGVEVYTFKGVDKIGGFAPVPLVNWSVCMTQDRSEFLAPAYRIGWIILAIGLISLAVAIIGVSFFARGVARPIGHVANELNEASEQVASASSQVASASQSLAEGASEQASALEETSSSLEEMSSMTKQNADNAAQAKALTSQAKQIVDTVDGQMHHMVTAIQEVTKSSEETGKIIKTIDEIAFQTNLLALNAAVEAARAGEAGAGFAVVAGEVRNLAMRAAEAAKNTSSLIENTIVTVRRSRDLTQQTQEAFKENVDISNKIGQLIDEIAAASSEQAQGISQIGKAVAEMDKVVQQTAANAEESASASEEMNAQAMQMKKNVEQLVTIIGGAGPSGISQASHQPIGPERRRAERKPGKPAVKKLLIAGPSVPKKGKTAHPSKRLSLEKGNFEDF